MAQHDYIIADQSGASFLDDLNDMAAAIASTNAGATEPATKYAYMPWADTTTGIFKVRNAANTAWISIFNLATGALIGTAANALALSGIGSSIDSAVQGGSLSSIIGQHTNNNLLRFSLTALTYFGCITTDNIASQSVASATNGGTSGTFTITGTGFTSNPSTTATWRLNNGVVTLYVPLGTITGTSNAVAFTLTGLPAAIQPTSNQRTGLIEVLDNTSIEEAGIGTVSGSVITLNIAAGMNNFTASGTKALMSTVINWPKD